MNNIDIVKEVLKGSTLFNGTARVSDYSSVYEVKVITKNVFIRYSDVDTLKLFIEQKGGKVKDIEISYMPALANAICLVVNFEYRNKINWD